MATLQQVIEEIQDVMTDIDDRKKHEPLPTDQLAGLAAWYARFPHPRGGF